MIYAIIWFGGAWIYWLIWAAIHFLGIPGSSKVFDIPLGGYAGNYGDDCNNYKRGGVSKAKEERCTCFKRGI